MWLNLSVRLWCPSVQYLPLYYMPQNESLVSYLIGFAGGVVFELVGWLYLIQLVVQMTGVLIQWITGNSAHPIVTFGHKLLGVTGSCDILLQHLNERL